MHFFETLVQDVRFGLRVLRKSPGFTTVAVLTLALGIGANTAIFSLIDAVMLRLLPVQKPQELVTLLVQEEGRAPDVSSFSNALWEAVRDQQDIFTGIFAWQSAQFDLAQGGVARYVNGMFVSGDYFDTLGITPATGRLIGPGDDHRGCTPVAVLSYGFWQSHFAGAESAVGSTVRVNHLLFQVIGVSRSHFSGVEVGKNFDVALPLCTSALFDKRNLDSRSRWWLNTIGRVKSGTTPVELKTRLDSLSPAIMQAALPDYDAAGQQRFLRTKLIPVPAGTGLSDLRHSFSGPLNILMGMVGLVLLIACANIAGMMLARAAGRGKEIAIRKALGASPSRLIRQLTTESVLLSLLGGGVGLLFAIWGSRLLVHTLSTAHSPIFVDLSLSGPVLGFTAAVAIFTGVLVGLLPAFRSNRVPLLTAMKEKAAAESGQHSRFWAGKWIVCAQVALSLMLLVGSGLLLRTFIKLLTLDAGFDRNNVLLVTARAPWWAADTEKVPVNQREAVFDEIGRRLRAIPGVTSVARSFITPVDSTDNYATDILSDVPDPPKGQAAVAWFNFVSPGYFATVRTPLLAGRDFNDQDTRNSLPVAIVNQALARKFFPGVNPLGRRFSWKQGPADNPLQVFQVVGTVKDSKYQSMRKETPPTAFLPAARAPADSPPEDFELRTSLEPSVLIPEVQRTVADVNQEIPLEFSTLADQINDDLVQERLLAALPGFFSVLALLLAAIGLYGVLSYLVTQRQSEFGLRMALGAPPASILRLVMRDVAVILCTGLLAGIALALACVRMLQSLLFGLDPHDGITIIGASAVLSVVALIAAYLPARRAMRVDPMVALRYE